MNIEEIVCIREKKPAQSLARTIRADESSKARRTDALEHANLVHTGGAFVARITGAIVNIYPVQKKKIKNHFQQW